MQYLLLIYQRESDWAALSETETGKIFQEYMEFSRGIRKSGNYVGGNALQPVATATTVRVNVQAFCTASASRRRNPASPSRAKISATDDPAPPAIISSRSTKPRPRAWATMRRSIEPRMAQRIADDIIEV